MVQKISDYLGDFFYQKICQRDFTAYYAFINKQTIEETEDETIIRVKKGLTLEQRINWNTCSPMFLKNNVGEMYHLHVKNQEMTIPYKFDSTCILEKIGSLFNDKKIDSRAPFDEIKIPTSMLEGSLLINYMEAEKSFIYNIDYWKKKDLPLLNEFLKHAVSSPYPLITPLKKAPPGALSIVEDYKEGTLSFSTMDTGLSICHNYDSVQVPEFPINKKRRK